jgi:hypothetical protein
MVFGYAGFCQITSITNVRSGVWSDPTTWSNNSIPTDSNEVYLSYDIIIDVNGTCNSFRTNGKNVTINPGVSLNISAANASGGESVTWSKTFGGKEEDRLQSVARTIDGGYVVVGFAKSNDGDVTGNHGDFDALIIKIDAAGNKQWSKLFGGTNADYATSIIETADTGYIVAGYSYSNDGDISGNHGGSDGWVMKLDPNGNKQWSKVFGGTLYDDATSIVAASDGGYVMTGTTSSNNGDVTGNHGGGGDGWILKLDSNGNKQWSKVLGGTNSDRATCIKTTADGGYVTAGHTRSNDGDVINNNGLFDAWLMKLDANGNKQWSRVFGGTSDEDDFSIISTADNGYLMVGRTNSNDGEVAGNHGNYDALVIKSDVNGNKQWIKTFGGSGYDGASAVISTVDGNYLIPYSGTYKKQRWRY